ncbi:hypothetical protein CYMTET_36576 [Cymbomonas tetramitiformis]|uniref:CN hydrolase domain-containing protein n=1 Tax=Cymbomonas tetramitiformis TaxID=36881 RepID=A0AAE0CFP5_9CHLO|nr:hypothetical protein CYMTET_36576 [Cymbomonas tetramitiformis]|eukprot:gene9665-11456_t
MDLLTRAFIESAKETANRHQVHLLVTVPYQCAEGEGFYGTAFMIDRNGREICRHQKAYLCDEERRYFLPGKRMKVSVCHLPRLEVGIGIAICYDVFNFSVQQSCYNNEDIGVMILPVYCGASLELGELAEVSPREALASAQEAAAGYADMLVGPSRWAAR